jgi:site-specific recombinase XerD
MSALQEHLSEYLRLRRLLGHGLAEAHRLLPRFVDYLDANDTEFVTVEAALAWSLQPQVPAGSVVPGHRMMVVRGFARYLSGIDPRTEIPPAGLVRIPRRWRPPFIYSDADIVALMDQAHRAIPQPLRAATYQTLIGLLAATGLRVGEALRLDEGDIDYADGVLHVRRSKFGKSRLVPLLGSTVDALERYVHRRRRLYPSPSAESLFVSLRGTRVIYESVWPTHRECPRICVGMSERERHVYEIAGSHRVG